MQTKFEKYLIEEIGITKTRTKDLKEAIEQLHRALCRMDTENLSKVHKITFGGLMREYIKIEEVRNIMPESSKVKDNYGYGWIITKDHISESIGGKSRSGKMGPYSISESVTQRLKKGEGTKFRLYDDDGILYAEGLQITKGDEESEFAPLDDYGTPNWGCTELRQYIDGNWIVL